MKEIPYTDLRFKDSPVRRRIFWSLLAGFAVATVVSSFLSTSWLIPDVPSITVGFLISVEYQARISLFACAALFVHLILLLIEHPRFQFSLLRLLIVSIFAALIFALNLLPYPNTTVEVYGTETMTIQSYGWPLPVCSVTKYDSGSGEQFWHPFFFTLSGGLLLLAALNILFFKLPQPAKPICDVLPSKT